MVRKYRIVTWRRLKEKDVVLTQKEAVFMLKHLDSKGDRNEIYTLEEVEVEEE
jgi:hypothetical protein